VNDLHELISACKQGDSRAQEQLFLRFGSKMLAICRRYCSNVDDAHDALQDGFVKVFQAIEKYRGDSAIETWMTRIFINTAIDQFKKSARYGELFPGREQPDVAADEYQEFEGFPCTPEQALAAMERLPSGYRMVFNLYALEGFNHRQIAEKLGISEGTSKSQYARARKQLQELLMQLTRTT
jgi:RNA polymerase sigma factor (sigma-70 family)